MELEGYFLKQEEMDNLKVTLARLYSQNIDVPLNHNLLVRIGKILNDCEHVNGNCLTDAEISAEEHKIVTLNLWEPESDGKIDISAKLRERLLKKEILLTEYQIIKDNKRIGVAYLKEVTPILFWISYIEIFIGNRHKGYGKKLLGLILKDAEKENVVIQLEAESSGKMTNKQLINWYKSQGFKTVYSNLLIK